MSWVCFLKFKLQAFDCFRRFEALVEKQCGRCIKTLCTCRGGGFLSNKFKIFSEENGIQRELIASYIPE